MFQPVQGEAAVMRVKGGFKVADLYERNGYLYAKINGKFVRLMWDGSTTDPNIAIDEMTWDKGTLFHDGTGKLCRVSVPGAKVLPETKAVRLLGAPLPTSDEQLQRALSHDA